ELAVSERHDWACFAAQQAAEKALKAALLSRGDEVWGHSVYKLGSSLRAPNDLLDLARVLDTYYIPTRYANGIDEGAPFESFGAIQSEPALDFADKIIRFARSQMASTR